LKSITVVADDRVGLLADVSYILAKSRINIESITVEIVSGKAIIFMGLSDSKKGKDVLEAATYNVESDTLVVKVPPGEMEKLNAELSKNGVKVESSKVLAKDDKVEVVSLAVDKTKRASKVLQKYLITNEEGR